VADDERVLRVLAMVDSGKRQPNLLFGALRWLEVSVDDASTAVESLLRCQAEVLAVMHARRTQTNEVARCATRLPALASLPSLLAIVEVGARACCRVLTRSLRDGGSCPGRTSRLRPGQRPGGKMVGDDSNAATNLRFALPRELSRSPKEHHHVTRPCPQLLHLTRRLRHR
jgi:Uncharacterized protein conserved in bacteria (DUF2332)